MKTLKIQKKLSLRRETLHGLKDEQLREAGGAWECTVTEIGCTHSKLGACGY